MNVQSDSDATARHRVSTIELSFKMILHQCIRPSLNTVTKGFADTLLLPALNIRITETKLFSRLRKTRIYILSGTSLPLKYGSTILCEKLKMLGIQFQAGECNWTCTLMYCDY